MKIYRYFVEGECEKFFVKVFSHGEKQYFKPGKVDVHNVVNESLSSAMLRTLKNDTTLILIYDVDKYNSDLLQQNLKSIRKYARVREIIHIQSVKNFEDELIRCSKINNLNEIFSTESTEEFKKKFLACKDLCAKMEEIELNFNELWNKITDQKELQKFRSDPRRIKKS
ncbi:MAG: hypothetical protein WC366_04035 [Bacilli bacterium]|jgi:hypothetical protein